MSETQASSLLEFRDVHKSFGDLHVLRGVTMNVRPADVVVLIGPSGSGKSTLLKCANALEQIDRGEVIFDGRPVTHTGREVNRVRAKIGMVFQQFNLFPHLTVLRNITLGPTEVRKIPKHEAEQRARSL